MSRLIHHPPSPAPCRTHPDCAGMRMLRAAALSLFLGSLTAGTQAADSAAGLPMPAEDQVRAVLLEHPRVRAARDQREMQFAHADAIQTGSAEITLRGNLLQRRTNDAGQFTEGQIAIERPVRLWGKGEADARLADATRAAGDLSWLDAQHETARELLGLWFDVLRAGQLRLLTQLAAEHASALAKQVQQRMQAGDASRLDAQQAQAEATRLQAARHLAEAGEHAAQATLSDRFPTLPLPAAIASLPLPDTLTHPVQLRADYLQHSHELRRALADADRGQQLADRLGLERHPDPTVGLFANIERGGAEKLIGLSLAVPIGNRARSATAASAAAEANALRWQAEDMQRRLSAEFDQTWHTLQGQLQAAAALREAAAQQADVAQRSERAYILGELALADLLVTRRLADEARLTAATAMLDAHQAYQRLLLDLHRVWDFDSPP